MCNNQSCQASLALAHSITLVCYGDNDDNDKEEGDGLPAKKWSKWYIASQNRGFVFFNFVSSL